MIFFEITPSTKKDRYEFPLLICSDSDPLIEWTKGVRASTDATAAAKVPMNFVLQWGRSWKGQPMEKKADWPAAGLLRPACSERFWNIVKPFADGAVWLRFPNFVSGEKSDWGFIFNLPLVDIEDGWNGTAPDFFASNAREIDRRFFVSEKVKNQLVEAGMTGMKFKKMPLDEQAQRSRGDQK